MKRKDSEVYDEFMDFSLSSPARKIRRLDASELPPTMELVETASAMTFDDALSRVDDDIVMRSWQSVHEDSPPDPSDNEERAIVLYKPVEPPPFSSPGSTNLSLRITSDFLRGLKNHVLNPGNQRFQFHAEDEKESEADSCPLAIVPWAPPSQAAMAISGWFAGSQPQSQSMLDPMMESDAEDASMEVEDTRQATGYSEGDEGFQQVPQHWTTPQFLSDPNTSNPGPTMWSF